MAIRWKSKLNFIQYCYEMKFEYEFVDLLAQLVNVNVKTSHGIFPN